MRIRLQHKYLYQFSLALAIVCANLACSSIESITNADSELEKSFTLGYNCIDVQNILSSSLASINFKIKRVENKTGCEQILIAANSISGISWGELVRVHIKPTASGATRMSVLTKRRLVTNVSANNDWSKQVLVAVLKPLESQSN